MNYATARETVEAIALEAKTSSSEPDEPTFVSLRYEVFISPSGADVLCWQHICVKNIGVGPARKVEFGG